MLRFRLWLARVILGQKLPIPRAFPTEQGYVVIFTHQKSFLMLTEREARCLLDSLGGSLDAMAGCQTPPLPHTSDYARFVRIHTPSEN